MTTATSATPATTREGAPPDPALIVQLASGFMAAKHLFAANELGIFEALGDSPTTLEGLAARTGLTPRAARISADAMVALRLLERDGDIYRNSPVATAFLAGMGPMDLRPVLRTWDTISYPKWCHLAESLARGPVQGSSDLDDHQQELLSAGIEAFQTPTAAAFAETIDFGCHERLLDVGGGTGLWSIAAARRHDNLRATVFELPAVAEIAQRRIADAGLGGRIDVIAGDAMSEPLPSSHDVVLVANLVHYWSPEENRALLRRVRDAVEPGTTLLLADFWTNETHTEPLIAALMAGEFAVYLPNGDVYSVADVQQWLPDAGWRFRNHVPLIGPQSLIIAEAA